ncbi:MAG: OmpA family protein [Bryobacteraceae bacterium]
MSNPRKTDSVAAVVGREFVKVGGPRLAFALLSNPRKTDSVAAGVGREFVKGWVPRQSFALLKDFHRLGLLLGATLLAAGCTPRKLPVPPAPAAAAQRVSIVVLLKDADGNAGRAIIRNAGGTVQLDQANAAVKISREDIAPGNPEVMNEAEIQRLFGNVLGALPSPEVRFTLTFLDSSDELTTESKASLGEIMKVIQERRSTFVSVTGHTDTTGTSESNYQLGLRRAESVAEFVKAAGVAASALWISSHGEGDLAVTTADEVMESRNRRVEIVIR